LIWTASLTHFKTETKINKNFFTLGRMHIGFTLQSHFRSIHLALFLALAAIPRDIQALIASFTEWGWKDFVETIDGYNRAWKFAQEYKYRVWDVEMLIEIQARIMNSPHFGLRDNFVRVRCGSYHFPVHKSWRSTIERLLDEYNSKHNIYRLVRALLHDCHCFEDGNGRLARLLLSLHFKKLLYFRYNRKQSMIWFESMLRSDRALAKLVRHEKRKRKKVPELFNPREITSTTTTTQMESTTTTEATCHCCRGNPIFCTACKLRLTSWFKK
jgi:hypothetical protein